MSARGMLKKIIHSVKVCTNVSGYLEHSEMPRKMAKTGNRCSGHYTPKMIDCNMRRYRALPYGQFEYYFIGSVTGLSSIFLI